MTANKRGDVVLVGFVFSDESGKKLRPAVAINSSAYNHTVTRGMIDRKLGAIAKVDMDAVDQCSTPVPGPLTPSHEFCPPEGPGDRVISRRAFVGGLAAALGAGAAPARAQQRPAGARPYRVGVLITAFGPNPPVVLGLKAGLAELGLHDGREVLFEIVHTRGQLDTLPAGVAGLVNAKVDVIFAALESPARAAMMATPTIPIVFAQIGDPVAAGIVKSIAQPGSNVTGVSGLTTDLAPKRLEALKNCAPSLKRVWAVYAHDDLSSAASVRKAREAAPALRLELLDRPVRSHEEAVSILKTVPRTDGLLAPTAISLDITARVLDLAPFVPGVFDTPYWVKGGGLVAYGVDHEVQGRQAARLVARILRGARPEDLPVENSTKFELAINLKTAKQLGLTIPQSLLLRADQVIQ